MRSRLQAGLIRTYRLIDATGLLSTAFGEWAFRSAYTGYKRFIEAGHLWPLQSLVSPGTSVVDVGANLGFFTLEFARWGRDGGKVLAIEPEAVNYGRLCPGMRRRRYGPRGGRCAGGGRGDEWRGRADREPAPPGRPPHRRWRRSRSGGDDRRVVGGPGLAAGLTRENRCPGIREPRSGGRGRDAPKPPSGAVHRSLRRGPQDEPIERRAVAGRSVRPRIFRLSHGA